ncbi:MAG: hypothetical protein JOZ39_01345, partial [Chloroflexi bacterium]|nr:hypothetical protein [Chloroflexota bacterium]
MIAEPIEIYRHDPATLRENMALARADITRRPSGRAYRLSLGLTGLLGLAAAGAVVVRLVTATSFTDWGYTAATAAFLVSSVQAAPAMAVISRLTRGYWATSLRRISELLALAGLVSTPLLLILLYQLPDWTSRPSIWFGLVTAPQAPDAVAIVLFALAGLGLMFLGALPDRAAQPRSGKQWATALLAPALLGSLYLTLLLYVDMLVVSDMAVSLVSGWHSSDMPVYQVFTGFEAALAACIVALAAVRHFCGLQSHIHED